MEASALAHASRHGLLARRSPLLRLQGDDSLVALVRAGNASAFEVLWDRYRNRLLSYCRSIVRSSEDAEDVLQEVFVNAHAAMIADEREIQVRPWLYRIARNRSLNHLRKPVADGQDSMDIHLHAHGEDAHDDAERREKVRQLVADVKTLPETQRTALILREIDALSYDEIAQAMETTIPSVKSLLVRARISLAEASECRLLTCDEVRVELAAAAEGLAKVNGPMRRHVRECEECQGFRKQLRADGKALAALSPLGLLALAHGLLLKVFGGGAAGTSAVGGGAAGGAAGAAATGATGAVGAAGAAASGAIATGTAGGGALLGGIGGAVGVKAAATAATAAIITAGAVEVTRQPERPAPAPSPIVKSAERPSSKPAQAPAPVEAKRPVSEPAPTAAEPEVLAPILTAEATAVVAAGPESAEGPPTAPTPAEVGTTGHPHGEAGTPAPLVDPAEGREPPPGSGSVDQRADGGGAVTSDKPAQPEEAPRSGVTSPEPATPPTTEQPSAPAPPAAEGPSPGPPPAAPADPATP